MTKADDVKLTPAESKWIQDEIIKELTTRYQPLPRLSVESAALLSRHVRTVGQGQNAFYIFRGRYLEASRMGECSVPSQQDLEDIVTLQRNLRAVVINRRSNGGQGSSETTPNSTSNTSTPAASTPESGASQLGRTQSLSSSAGEQHTHIPKLVNELQSSRKLAPSKDKVAVPNSTVCDSRPIIRQYDGTENDESIMRDLQSESASLLAAEWAYFQSDLARKKWAERVDSALRSKEENEEPRTLAEKDNSTYLSLERRKRQLSLQRPARFGVVGDQRPEGTTTETANDDDDDGGVQVEYKDISELRD